MVTTDDGDRLHKRCQDLVADLEIPSPFSLSGFCTALATRRGQPITLVPTEFTEPGICGMWIGTTDEDRIFYERHTSEYHSRQIVFHEVGHMLLTHQGTDAMAAAILRMFAPDLAPASVRHVMGRDAFGPKEEHEAETFAYTAMQSVGLPTTNQQTSVPTESVDAIDRIEAALRGAPIRR